VHRWSSRRGLLGLLAAGLGLAALPGEARAQAGCSWRRISGPRCINGQSQERWCYICCDAAGTCTTQRCEYRVVGACSLTATRGI
jgi:hypothetical protein